MLISEHKTKLYDFIISQAKNIDTLQDIPAYWNEPYVTNTLQVRFGRRVKNSPTLYVDTSFSYTPQEDYLDSPISSSLVYLRINNAFSHLNDTDEVNTDNLMSVIKASISTLNALIKVGNPFSTDSIIYFDDRATLEIQDNKLPLNIIKHYNNNPSFSQIIQTSLLYNLNKIVYCKQYQVLHNPV